MDARRENRQGDRKQTEKWAKGLKGQPPEEVTQGLSHIRARWMQGLGVRGGQVCPGDGCVQGTGVQAQVHGLHSPRPGSGGLQGRTYPAGSGHALKLPQTLNPIDRLPCAGTVPGPAVTLLVQDGRSLPTPLSSPTPAPSAALLV